VYWNSRTEQFCVLSLWYISVIHWQCHQLIQPETWDILDSCGFVSLINTFLILLGSQNLASRHMVSDLRVLKRPVRSWTFIRFRPMFGNWISEHRWQHQVIPDNAATYLYHWYKIQLAASEAVLPPRATGSMRCLRGVWYAFVSRCFGSGPCVPCKSHCSALSRFCLRYVPGIVGYGATLRLRSSGKKRPMRPGVSIIRWIVRLRSSTSVPERSITDWQNWKCNHDTRRGSWRFLATQPPSILTVTCRDRPQHNSATKWHPLRFR
jgi:hypothetical protein